MFCFVKGEPKGREAKRWLDDATRLGLACAYEVHGDDDRAHFTVMTSVRTAAASVWFTSDGRPSWKRLDVGGLTAFMERQGLPEEMMQIIMMDLYAFFTFLRRHGLIPRANAEIVQEKLWPFVAPLFEEAMRTELEGNDPAAAHARGGRTEPPVSTSSG